MQILPVALERLATSKFDVEHIVSILKTLELALQNNGSNSGEIVLSYQSDEDVVTVDDWIPVVTFSLRPAKVQ